MAKVYYEKMLSLKELKSTNLTAYQSKYFSKWYFAAIRALIALEESVDQDPQKLANTLTPKISEEEAEQALNLLINLNLIQLNVDNKYELVENIVKSNSAVKKEMIHSYLWHIQSRIFT